MQVFESGPLGCTFIDEKQNPYQIKRGIIYKPLEFRNKALNLYGLRASASILGLDVTCLII